MLTDGGGDFQMVSAEIEVHGLLLMVRVIYED